MVEKGKDSTQEPMSTLAESGSDYSPAGLVSLGKNLLALLRDAALFVLALLLLVFPTSFNTVLTNAGFEEGSLAGFKWRGKLVASDSALKDAQATITKLKEQLDKSSQALHNAEAKVNDPVVKAELNKTEMENKQLDTASSKVQESVNTTINNSAPLVEKAQTSVSTNGPWGVVFSGDTTLDKAKYETDIAYRKYGIPSAVIYFRQGFFRTVALAGSRSEAEGVLPKARVRRSDAYIVNMSTWCPNPVKQSEYQECSP